MPWVAVGVTSPSPADGNSPGKTAANSAVRLEIIAATTVADVCETAAKAAHPA